MTTPATPTRGDNFWLPWAAAILLFVVSLTLAWQVARLTKSQMTLQATLERTQAPRTNVPLVHLDAVTRSEGDDAAVSGDELFVLVVTPDAPDPYPEYRVEVTDASGEVVEDVRGLETSDPGTLRLAFSSLPEGDHEVTVWGLDATGEDVAETGRYRLRVR